MALSAVGLAQLTLAVNPLTAVVAALDARQLRAGSTRRSSCGPRCRRSSAPSPARLPARDRAGPPPPTRCRPAGWVLFGIVFMWQMPHFLAIAWLFRDDYANAGIPLLPVIEPDGRTHRTTRRCSTRQG